MAEPAKRAVKRQYYFSDSNDSESDSDFDSDDSVKDKDYVDKEVSGDSSDYSTDQVNK